jgi:spore germination protein
MLPTALALTIAASRENLPFTAIIEAFLMEGTIELLREAGARLPKPIGQTIGIVGGIIIGDAAVRAGIASPIMIIVVAVTAISSFVIPNYSLAISFRILRFPIMIASAVFGLYGVILGFIVLTVHVANLKSFGYNYAAPLMPISVSDLKDSIIRVPNEYMYKRPESTEPIDKYRGKKQE